MTNKFDRFMLVRLVKTVGIGLVVTMQNQLTERVLSDKTKSDQWFKLRV